MSIASITEVWSGRSGQQDWKGVVKYVRRFRAYTTTNADHSTAILSSGSIPSRLQSHPDNPYALVSDRVVRNDPADPLKWDVEVTYTSQFDQDPASTNENPLLRPAIWSFSFEHATRAVREDLDGNPIINSAGLPIDPPLEIEVSVPVITIDINVASFSYATVAAYQDAVNSDTWQGFAPGQVKVRGINVKTVYENNQVYYAKTWTLAVKWDLWTPVRILDAGYQHLGDEADGEDDGEMYINRDRFGNPLPHPARLDGEGHLLDTGEESVYLPYEMCRPLVFTGVVGL